MISSLQEQGNAAQPVLLAWMYRNTSFLFDSCLTYLLITKSFCWLLVGVISSLQEQGDAAQPVLIWMYRNTAFLFDSCLTYLLITKSYCWVPVGVISSLQEQGVLHSLCLLPGWTETQLSWLTAV